jgi:hypothetical protein
MEKRRQSENSFFVTEGFEVPRFGTGHAAEILEIPVWRLQKFLDSPQYNLSPKGKLGEGRGSRRVFSTDDLHRIALANRLVEDGFAPQFVGSALQRIEDTELGVYLDGEGNETEQGLAFYRAKDRPVVKVYAANNPRVKGQKNPPYYWLEFSEVFGPIDERIRQHSKGEVERSRLTKTGRAQ